MKKLLAFLLNTIFFTIVIVIAVAVATIALTRKVNEYEQQFNKGITGTVIKEEVPVLSSSQGVIKKIHVKVGQEVKKNDLLVEIDNPGLRGKIQALQNYPDNVSAQTEAKVAQQQLSGLNIYAPVDGVINDITVVEGMPIDSLSKVMTMYSDDNIRLTADLTTAQYTAIQQLHQVPAYDDRLSQTFMIVPDILNPNEKTATKYSDKEISMYFVFKNEKDAISLLNNEDLSIRLANQDQHITKPIDVFVAFWNSTLGKAKSQ